MCCNLFYVNLHFCIVYLLSVKCISYLIKKIKKYGIYHKTYIVPKATFSHTGCNCRKLPRGICKCCKGGRGGTYHEEKLWEVFCGNLASKFWISPYLTKEFVFVSVLGLDVCSYLKFLTIRPSGEGPKLHKKTFDYWRMELYLARGMEIWFLSNLSPSS